MVEGILLDIDNTLYEYEPCHKAGMACVANYSASKLGIQSDVFLAAFSQSKKWVKSNLPETASSHNRLLYMQKTCELLGVCSTAHSLKMYNEYWDEFLQKMTLGDDARIFLEENSRRQICLVTDLTSHIQFRKIDRLGLSSRVKFMVTSEEVGHEKPHPYIYQAALMKLKMQVSQVCMIGDSLSKDAVGPANIGIKGYWYCKYNINVENFEAHPMVECIQDLSEVFSGSKYKH